MADTEETEANLPVRSAKIGRPTKYSEEWAAEFCEMIAEGHYAHRICQEDDNQPHSVQVYRWLEKHEEFRSMYARARDRRADRLFDELIELADKATPVTANAVRLQVDTRKFVVARLAPRKYGDRIEHDVKGGINFQPQILIQCSSDREEPQVKIATHHEPKELQ